MLWLVQDLAPLNIKQKSWTEKYFRGLCRGSLTCSRKCCMSVLREETLLHTACLWFSSISKDLVQLNEDVKLHLCGSHKKICHLDPLLCNMSLTLVKLRNLKQGRMGLSTSQLGATQPDSCQTAWVHSPC